MEFNSPDPVPPNISGNSEFSTNYTNFMEVKNFTDGVLVIDNGYIHNIKDPVENRDAANKQYVLDNATGDSGTLKTWKNAVNAASTANIISLSGIQTIDGILLLVDYRVLVKDQNTPSENGIYLVSESAWTRAIDASVSPPVQASGTAIYVLAGTSNANKVYTCNTISSAPNYEPVFYGSPITFTVYGQSTPGGSNTQVQYNNNGVLDGDANLVWTGNELKSTALKSNVLQALTTSDANIYTDHEAPLIIGNMVSPTISTTLLTNSGSILMGNQTSNNLLVLGSNRVSGTGSNVSIFTGSGSLGGSLYIGTGSSSANVGPPIVLRPGSGSVSHGNVIVNPVSPTESISASTGSLVVYGGLGVTGSITTNGTLTGTQLLPNGRIFVGSSNGISAPVVMSGDVSIVNTGITTLATVTTAGTYSTANITVDAKGRVISASNGSGAGPGGASGTVQYNNAGSFGSVSNFSSPLGSNLVGNTSSELYIGNSSNLTGSIGPLSVAGSAFIGRSLIIGETLGAKMPLLSGQILVGSSTNLSTNAVMTGDASISNTGVLSLASVITPGTYTNANISIDANGRIRVASNGTSGGIAAGPNMSLQYNNVGSLNGLSTWLFSTENGLSTLYGSGSNTSIVLLGTSNNSINTLGGLAVSKSTTIGGSVSVNGNLTVGGTLSGLQILPSAQILVGSSTNYATNATMSGDATISNTGALTLDSIVTAGTFSSANITIDSKGRVLAASNGGTAGNLTGDVTSVGLVTSYNNVVPVIKGGTGTSTAFTEGSIVFTGTGGTYIQDNSSLNFGSTSKILTVNSINVLSTVDSNIDVSYLVAAGGGGGAGGAMTSAPGQYGSPGSGGGAGGLLIGSGLINSCYITVGTGGSGSLASTSGAVLVGTNGSNSSIGLLIDAVGGGGGAGSGIGVNIKGGDGGSGGGGTSNAPDYGYGIAGQGFRGSVSQGGGGGSGGGSSTIGQDTITDVGAVGGAGTASSISGSSVTYAAGGSGGGRNAAGGAGVTGGGGAGGTASSGSNATGFGSGGGGGAGILNGNPLTFNGGSGSNGIVIISYPGSQRATGGTVTSSGGNTIHTFTSSGTFLLDNPSINTAGGIVAGGGIVSLGEIVANDGITCTSLNAVGTVSGSSIIASSGSFDTINVTGTSTMFSLNLTSSSDIYASLFTPGFVFCGKTLTAQKLVVNGTATDSITTSGGLNVSSTSPSSITTSGGIFSNSLNIYGTGTTSISSSGGLLIAKGITANTLNITSTADSSILISYLVVAGGGGGGSQAGIGPGGGGAGGLLTGSGSISSCSITVGTGGAGGASNNAGTSGSNSSIGSIVVAVGGGGGANGAITNGLYGGSGGGGLSIVQGAGGAGISGQGFAGGAGAAATGGGGGGGSSSVGTTIPGAAGNGGNGTTSTISGSSVTYAGGGGAGGGSGGTGGTGGGGSSSGTVGSAATGFGSGGGGGGTSGGAGSNGVVIISYPGSAIASGGTITSSGGNTIHTFTSSGSFTLLTTPSIITAGGISATKGITANNLVITNINSNSLNVNYLIVAGGGAGGSGTSGGGGGGGGVLTGTGLTIASTTAIVVGTGGSGVVNTMGNPGTNSSLGTSFICYGGGGGAGGNSNPATSPAGSGGGGTSLASSAGLGRIGQGYWGGAGISNGGGGGGGAGGVGSVGVSTIGGAGGPGIASTISGVSVTYGAGGGGRGSVTPGAGGTGGGGAGGGTNGANATGIGAGGGASTSATTPGSGANGIVVISYFGAQAATGGTVTSANGFTIHTFTTSDTFIVTANTVSIQAAGDIYTTKNSVSDGHICNKSTVQGPTYAQGTIYAQGSATLGGNAAYYAFNGSTFTGVFTGADPTSIFASNVVAGLQFNAFSDQRIKENIENIDPDTALESIKKMRPVTYNYIDKMKGTGIKYGYIADEVSEIFDNSVRLNK